MHELGVVTLPTGGEITVVPNGTGGVFVAIHQNGLAVSLGLSQEAVGELRAALAFPYLDRAS